MNTGRVVDVRKIKQICVADTYHDFASDRNEYNLKDNMFLKDFIKEYEAYLQDINLNDVEDSVMNLMGIKDRKVTVDKLDNYATLTVHSLREQQDKNNSFTVKCDDVTKREFKNFLGSVIATGSRLGNINVISDANMLKRDIICDIKVLNKSASIIDCEASKYDRGNMDYTKASCIQSKNIPATLTADGGNLFGLNSISVSANILQYEYNGQSPKVIVLDEFNKALQNAEEKYLTFLAGIISKMFDKYNDADTNKRKFDEVGAASTSKKQKTGKDTSVAKTKSILSLDTVLKDLNDIYKLDYKAFNFYNEKNKGKKSIDLQQAKQFVKILFDFKRAGDQLQAKSCEHDKDYVFLTNDKIAIAYAYAINVPCIKTTKYKKEAGQAHSVKKFSFYNFDTEKLVAFIEKIEYYKEVIELNLTQYASFLAQLKEINHNINLSVSEIESRCQLFLQTIMKSMKILNWAPNFVNKATSDTRNNNITTNIYEQTFIYEYVHKYNVILHILAYMLFSHIQVLDQLEQKLKSFKEKYQQINTVQGQMDKNQFLKRIRDLLLEIDNDISFKTMKSINLSSNNNAIFFKHVIGLYDASKITDEFKILYDMSNPELNILQSNHMDKETVIQVATEYFRKISMLPSSQKTKKNAEAYDKWLQLLTQEATATGGKKDKIKSFLNSYNFFNGVLPLLNSHVIEKHISVIRQNFVENSFDVNISVLQEFISFINIFYTSFGKAAITEANRIFYFPGEQVKSNRYHDVVGTEIFLQNDSKNVVRMKADKNKLSEAIEKYQNVLLDMFKTIIGGPTDPFMLMYRKIYITADVQNAVQRFKEKVISYVYVDEPDNDTTMTTGGGKKNIKTYFSLFLHELDELYATGDRSINDLIKLIILFFMYQYHFFDDDGNITDKVSQFMSDAIYGGDAAQTNKSKKSNKTGQTNKSEKSNKTGQSNKSEKSNKTGQTNKSKKTNKTGQTNKSEKSNRILNQDSNMYFKIMSKDSASNSELSKKSTPKQKNDL